MARPKGRGLLDFAQVALNLRGVPAARSRLFACLAFLLWATVGVLAVEHCHCDDVTADCEHAGQACAQPDDCSDCLVPSDPAALADAMVALLPPANVLVGAPLLVPVFAYGERCAVETARPIFISRSFACRPPALRAGTMCLRV
jgi:hypothetical protein